MKKFLSLALALLMVLTCVSMFAACSEAGTTSDDDSFKLGVILLHDEDSTYDLNFINGVNAAKEALGLTDDQIIIKRNISESNDCYEAALDLVAKGCDVIFADSFGHESYLLKAAKENPDVQFCHATGTMAHTENVANFHNAFASIYEGRYLAGIAAGMKLNEMIEAGTITADQAKMGYVGAFTFAEVISGYTSFYLGAKSVCPSVTMDVKFTGSWYNEVSEKATALDLINNGCVLISQHADSMGAPSLCEEKGVPNVSYNGSTQNYCPNTYIVSSRIDWAPYFQYICSQTMEGKTIDTNWCGTIATGSVVLTDVNESVAAPGTVDAINAVKAELMNGTRHVFDTKNFTVGGEALTSYMADVNTDDNFTPDTEVIENGILYESKYRSAPYFALQIDGITLLNTNYGS